MHRMDGMRVLVTGAARLRGLGRAMALRCAREGADVIVSGRPKSPDDVLPHEKEQNWTGTASLAEEIRDMGRKALAYDCDVTDRAQVQGLMEAIEDEFGGLDGIVNNAGVPSGAGAATIVEMDDELWYSTIDVNLNGVYLVSKLGVKLMLKEPKRAEKGGAIVNISSMAGRQGLAQYGAYCASKFGVIGFTQQLAVELAKTGIRVNCICPGSTDTDMMDSTFKRTADRVGAKFDDVKTGVRGAIPMGRQGRPEEQAAAVAFLMGSDASYITGQTLNVDGGLRMD